MLMITFLLIALQCGSPAFAAPGLGASIAAATQRVEEFRLIRKKADELGLRVWLFGGTAAGFAHYVKRDRPGADYDFTEIFRSTQDSDLVADGPRDQVVRFEEWLRATFPYLQGSKSKWEVRMLREARGDSEPLLDNPNFSDQHTDSHSIGLIELTDRGEPRVRDVNGTTRFLDDVREGKLHYYFSPRHEKTARFLAGKNPPILSAIRYLTKAFQFGLAIAPEDREKISRIIAEFDEAKDPYVASWIEKNAKKLFQNAQDLERAWDETEKLGLRRKLIALKKNPTVPESLAWWMSKEPLRSGTLATGGKTARELGLDLVAHETKSILVYEAITLAPDGKPNVFVSRKDAPGEAAVHGDGFYTRIGDKGARGTGITVRFKLNPDAREGKDFTRAEDYVIVLNRNALTIVPEALNFSVESYFAFLSEGGAVDENDKAILEKLRRRLTNRLAHSEEDAAVLRKVFDAEMARPEPRRLLLREIFRVGRSRLRDDQLRGVVAMGELRTLQAIDEHILTSPEWIAGYRGAPIIDEMIKLGFVPFQAFALTEWRRHPRAHEWIESLAAGSPTRQIKGGEDSTWDPGYIMGIHTRLVPLLSADPEFAKNIDKPKVLNDLIRQTDTRQLADLLALIQSSREWKEAFRALSPDAFDRLFVAFTGRFSKSRKQNGGEIVSAYLKLIDELLVDPAWRGNDVAAWGVRASRINFSREGAWGMSPPNFERMQSLPPPEADPFVHPLLEALQKKDYKRSGELLHAILPSREATIHCEPVLRHVAFLFARWADNHKIPFVAGYPGTPFAIGGVLQREEMSYRLFSEIDWDLAFLLQDERNIDHFKAYVKFSLEALKPDANPVTIAFYTKRVERFLEQTSWRSHPRAEELLSMLRANPIVGGRVSCQSALAGMQAPGYVSQ